MKRTYSVAEKREIAALYAEGSCSTDIAYAYNTEHRTILRIVRNSGGVARSIRQTRRWGISMKKYPEVIKAYQDGSTQRELSDAYGVSRSLISLVLKRSGINGRKNHRKYALNEHCFDDISESSAYWLGFLMADGCVTSRNCLSIHLASRDSNHLDKFRRFLNTDRPLYRSFSISAKGTPHSSVTLAVKSKIIINILRRYGIVERKTGKETSSKIPSLYLPHFFRGFIDGDGCYHVNPKGCMCLTIVSSSDEILKQLRNWVKASIGFDGGCFRLVSRKTYYVLAYNGNVICDTIINTLFDQATVYLDRKKNIIDLWMRKHPTAGCLPLACSP